MLLQGLVKLKPLSLKFIWDESGQNQLKSPLFDSVLLQHNVVHILTFVVQNNVVHILIQDESVRKRKITIVHQKFIGETLPDIFSDL